MVSAAMGSASGERTSREDGYAPWASGVGDPALAGASAARDRCREWRLPSTASSVTVLRRGLHAFLQGTSLSGDQIYDLLLAACEAASNAIEHAQHPSEPFVDVLTEVDDGRVSILVRDFGEWREALAGPYRGRGLGMMRALADMSLVSQPGGTTVTLRSRGLDLRPPDPGNASRDPANGDGRNVPRPAGS
jgi:anti-sigma regulatory factor (Ser/Thr protein kinase)